MRGEILDSCDTVLIILGEDILILGDQLGFHVFVALQKKTIIILEVGDAVVPVVLYSCSMKEGGVAFPSP